MFRLFHVIVDSDQTASQILAIMNKQKMAGEVTFLPLNKLQFSSTRYPSGQVGRAFDAADSCVGQYSSLSVTQLYLEPPLLFCCLVF